VDDVADLLDARQARRLDQLGRRDDHFGRHAGTAVRFLDNVASLHGLVWPPLAVCANRAMPCSGMIYYSDFFLVMVDCMVYNARLAITDWLAFVMRNPLDFSIQYPPRPEYFLENFATEPDEGPVRSSSPPELLYVHIPFCPSRCSYCVFATEPRVEPELMEQYVRAVLIEVQSNATLE